MSEQIIAHEEQGVRVQGMVAQLVVDHFRIGQAIGKNLGVRRRLPLAGEIVGPLVSSPSRARWRPDSNKPRE